MILERSMHPQWLSNTYLVAAGPGSDGFLVDAGGPVEPLLAAADENGVTVTHVLLTHHHHDHVAELDAVKRRWPDAAVLIHPDERPQVPGATGDLRPGEELEIGGLSVRALHTPGHTGGMLSLLVGGTDVFTGDTLFRNSVGGVRATGHTTYADLKRSIMDVLLALPPETRIRPGHTDPTTVADEWEGNAFVRVWRGLDPEGDARCTALGEPATLVLLGDDYDGGHKAWVRWADGSDDIVPGSRVERSG
jgi:hydroxyacylglutathione hydrolase